MKKRLVIVSMVLGIALWAVSAMAVQPIRIGAPLSLSGRAAFAGVPEKKGIEMAAAELNKVGGINGRPVEVIYYDDESKEDNAVRAVQRLIQKDKVDAIVGLTGSWCAMVALPIIEQHGIPSVLDVASVAVVKPVRRWVFKTPPNDIVVVDETLRHMQKHGIKRLAIVSSQDPYGETGRTIILSNASGFGINIVFDEKFTGEENDLTPLLNKIKNTNAEALVNWSSKRSPEIITMNYRQLGLTLPLYHNHAVLNQSFLDITGKNSDGVFIAGTKFYSPETLPDSDPQKMKALNFKARYKKIYGEEAVQYASMAYDAFEIIAMAMKKAGTNKEKVRAAIENTKNFVGTSGVFNFSPEDHNGLIPGSVAMYQAANGVWSVVK